MAAERLCRACTKVHDPLLTCAMAARRVVANSVVANAVVANRKGDRHRKTEARKLYQRDLMRARRAK